MADDPTTTAACGSTLRYEYVTEDRQARLLPDHAWICERPAGHLGVHSCDSASWGRADHFRERTNGV